MRITRVYIRFYESFNYDYERKFARASKPDPWDLLDGAWYPYVRLDLDVGANESGKSHLLDSIEKLIIGRSIERGDFCRYSHFFSVEHGQRRFPDFGGEFEVADEADVGFAKEHLGLDVGLGDRFQLLAKRRGPGRLLRRPGFADQNHDKPACARSRAPIRVPTRPNVPFPASIPLFELTPDARRPSGSRRSRWTILDQVLGKSWSSSDEFTRAAPNLFGLLSDRSSEGVRADRIDQQYELGRDLLFRVARIDPTAFKDLSDAIADEREGYVNGIIQKINQRSPTVFRHGRAASASSGAKRRTRQ